MRQLLSEDHRKLSAAVISEFRYHFAPSAKLLCGGGVSCESEVLQGLGGSISSNEKLPDIILHDQIRSRLFLIDFDNPISPKRFVDLENVFVHCSVDKIYVAAIQNFKKLQKAADDVAWGTNVWAADLPLHLIHFDSCDEKTPVIFTLHQ